MKVCFISSTGGHFEQIKQLRIVRDKFEHFYIIPKSKSTKSFPGKKYLIDDVDRKNVFKCFFILIKMFVVSIYIYIKEKPDVVISTGALAAIPFCLVAKFFKKKLIYIESFARINKPNKTGLFLYKFADLFIIQWKSLKKYYPKAIYGGWIY